MPAKLRRDELQTFLNEKADQYNHPDFIESDPIQVPHLFSAKEDIEIAGFLTATIAWGNRKSIITNATKLMELMGNAPYDFVMEYSQDTAGSTESFVHRTFNGTDLDVFIRGLQHLYKKYGGLETTFQEFAKPHSMQIAIHEFKKRFFEVAHPSRTQKHVSDPLKGSAAKRIHMFLRWMVRRDRNGVDFGIWTTLSPSQLSCPLDVHSGSVARKLGLLKRKQNDAKAVEELDQSLRKMDPDDPVKYDFALFGLGVFEKF